jgi:hypothetical protein
MPFPAIIGGKHPGLLGKALGLGAIIDGKPGLAIIDGKAGFMHPAPLPG